jgi:hypothetical protein
MSCTSSLEVAAFLACKWTAREQQERELDSILAQIKQLQEWKVTANNYQVYKVLATSVESMLKRIYEGIGKLLSTPALPCTCVCRSWKGSGTGVAAGGRHS